MPGKENPYLAFIPFIMCIDILYFGQYNIIIKETS